MLKGTVTVNLSDPLYLYIYTYPVCPFKGTVAVNLSDPFYL